MQNILLQNPLVLYIIYELNVFNINYGNNKMYNKIKKKLLI